jgi:phosphate-selective porin OprO/OprP
MQNLYFFYGHTMFFINRWLLLHHKSFYKIVLGITSGALFITSVHAQTATTNDSSTADTIQELKNEVQALSQKVDSLEDQQDTDEKSTQTQRFKNATTVTASSKGFQIQSADHQFNLNLKGLLQADDREFLTPNNNGASPGDGLYLRRARIIFDGTLWGAYSFRIEPEFGSRMGGAGGTSSTTATLATADVNIHYLEPLQFLVGRFKGPVGYERSQLVANNIWIENGLTQNLTTQYTEGFLAHGDIDDNVFSYGAGVFEDVRDNANTDIQSMIDNNNSFEGDVYVNPFKKTDIKALQGLGAGIAGSVGNRGDVGTASTASLASYYTPGQINLLTYNTKTATGQTVTESEDGPAYRLTPVIYYYYGPFGAYADYAVSSVRALRSVTGTSTAASPTGNRLTTFQNDAWQVVGSYVLTGENADYDNGVQPRNNFSLHDGNWGAFQLVARYGEMTLDNHYFTSTGTSTTGVGAAFATQGPRTVTDIGVGLNWYLNSNVKAQFQYDYDGYTGGIWPVNPENADPNSFLTQLQLAF